MSPAVIFCLPGNSFSGKFLECWTELVHYCHIKGIRMLLSRKESCNIYYVRNMCLGGDVGRGKDQKPFDGKLDYDFIMWIDSDVLFSPQQFRRLIDHDKDIVSGLYLMSNGKEFATVQNWDEDFFMKHHHFNFLTPEDVRGKEGLIRVDYTGLGFMLVKKGVFESLDYPWFRPVEKQIGDMVDFTMEDVGFCLRAREKGFEVLVDPGIKVGHEKKVIIQ